MQLILSIAFFIFLFNIRSYSQELTWQEPVNVTGLNSASDEFAPVWNPFQGQLYFNSNLGGYSKFYYSVPDANFNFKDFIIVEGEINLSRNNQSYITFETNEIAYISTYRLFKDGSFLNIFQTRKKKNSWLKPFDIDSLNYPLFMGHPTVSPDGTILIFSTTLNSGFGDTDLWMAFKQENGTWGSLLPIPALKTPGNEITPFLATNDTLYFASDGQEGPGGYDLFVSIRKDGIWQIPYPLSTLNTEFDESDFTIIPGGKALFASNRPGGSGGLDLYLTSKGKAQLNEQVTTTIDFSIAAQVPDVKIKGDITAAIVSVFIYFYFDKNEILNPDFKFIDNLSSNDADSIHLYSPKVISERIKKLKEHNLIVSIYSNDIYENEHELIRNNLKKSLDLPDDRITVKFLQLNDNQENGNISYMKFSSANEKVFAPFDISEYKMEVIPPALELSLDARPRTIIRKWECKLSVGANFEKSIKSNSELPAKFFHEIKSYSKELMNSDSLVITLYAEDTLNRKHKYEQVFNITHSSSRQDKYIVYKNKKYIEYFILLNDSKELREGNTFLNTFRVFSEKALDKKNIIIRCYSDIGKSIATGIKEYIGEQIGANDIQVKIDSEITKDKYSKKPFNKFLFSILVEI